MTSIGTPSRQLRARFVDDFVALKDVSTGIVLCYDGSGSVGARDFQDAITSGCILANNFPADVLVGVVQFSSKVEVACPMTKDKTIVKTQLEKMKQMKGSTQTDKGIASAVDLLTRTTSVSRMKILLITDGAPDDQRAAVNAGRDAMAKKVSIVGIGIGNVNKAALEEVCGTGNAYVLSNWVELVEAVNIPSGGSNTVENSQVEIAVTQLNLPASFKEDLTFAFEFRNSGDVSIPAESTFRVFDKEKKYRDMYYKTTKELKPRSTGKSDVEKAELVVERKIAARTIDDLPSCLYMEMSPPNSQRKFNLESNVIPIEIHNMWKDLLQWSPPATAKVEEANILAFGWKGSGKSTLINRMLEIVVEGDESERTVIRPALQSDDHVTQDIGAAGFDDNVVDAEQEAEMWREQMKNMKAKFVDVPGLDTVANVWTDPSQVKLLLEGAIQKKWKIGEEMAGEKDPTKEIHAVIFVIHASTGELKSKQEVVASSIRTLVASFKRMPIIVVTHIDAYDPAELMKDVKSYTGCDQIFLVNNSLPKSFETSKQYYKIMWAALNRSTVHMNQAKK